MSIDCVRDIEMLHDNVLLRVIEEKAHPILSIPSDGGYLLRKYVVVATGPDIKKKEFDDAVHDMDIAFRFGHQSHDLEVDGEKYVIVPFKEIVGVIREYSA